MHTATITTGTEFEEFARSRWDDAVRFARRISHDHHGAEDLVADAMLQLGRRWETTSIERPWGYLTRSIRNGLVDRVRAAERERNAYSRLGPPSGGPDAAAVIDDRALLASAFARIPDVQRRTLALRYGLGHSEREIAQLLAVPTGTVKSHAARGVRRLRAELTAPPPR